MKRQHMAPERQFGTPSIIPAAGGLADGVIAGANAAVQAAFCRERVTPVIFPLKAAINTPAVIGHRARL